MIQTAALIMKFGSPIL